MYAFALLGEQLAQQGPQGALGEKGALLAVVQAVYVQVPRDKLGARQADRAVFQVPLEGCRVDALPQEQPPQHLPVGLAANVLFLFMVNAGVKKKSNKIQGTTSDRIFDVVNFIIALLALLIVLIPLLNVVASSFSSGAAVQAGKVGIIPVEPTLDAYILVTATPSTTPWWAPC